MGEVEFPSGYRIELLRKNHRRASFRCGEAAVDKWLATKALQHQSKHLSTTKLLLTGAGELGGYYTLATAQVDFGDLSQEIAKKLPRRALPVVVLAWLGVSNNFQGQGLGHRLLAQALWDCSNAGRILPFIAVLLDCLNDGAKAYYQQWDFKELPGQPYRLYLGMKRLEAMLGEW